MLPETDSSGIIIGYVGSLTDISDRKLSEEKLRKSDIHLKTAQRIGKLGSWEFDPYTDQIVWSDEVFHIFGRDPAMGTPSFDELQEQIHPDDRANHQQVVQTAIANIQSFDLGFRFFRIDGSAGYIQSRGEPIVNATGQLTQLIGTVLDITDRKQAEEALRESEELKKRILESSSDCIKLIDLDGKLQYMNAWGKCIMEIDDFSLFLNSDWISLWPETSRLDIEAAIATAKTGQKGRFQGFRPTAKGTPKWWDVVVTPVLDESGQISQFLSVSRDISDRKQAEQEILEKQRFIQKIAEASPNILYLYDLQQHCNVYSNREIASVLGYTPTEIQAMGSALFANLMHPEDIAKIPDYYRQIEADQEGEIFEIEYRMRHANGEWRWLYSRDTVFSRDNRGKIKLTIGTAQDISDRKQAEEQLKNLSDRLTLSIKSGNIGIWDWNVTENILTWDDRMYELYGITPDRFASVYDAWASSLHPDDRTLTELAIQQALTGEKDYDPEFRIVHPDGTIRFIQAYALVQRNDRGEAIRMIGLNIDNTNQKRAEAKLRETSAQLSASNRELEAFAYSVSHDLRSPLRAIDGFSNALLEDYGDIFDADAKDYFDRIRSNVARMGTLIDDLLSLSRVSRSEIEYRNVNLSILVQEQLDELQTTDPQRQVEIAIAPNVWVSADSTLMRVVISNLIQNAWKFTSHHATALIEFGMLASENQQDDGQFTYFVRDNGAGFDMNYAKMLFKVFQRLHNTNEFAGTGIGLATVQRAIHRHGGRVWAEGAVEKGATIYFTLPNSSSQELK
jgi:PAS domain S-box-containing protein